MMRAMWESASIRRETILLKGSTPFAPEGGAEGAQFPKQMGQRKLARFF
jgi:hypothetical protein